MTQNIKSYTDEELISLINKIVMGEVEAEMSDLKAILAESSGRKLEKNYINIIAERIKSKISPEVVEPRRKPEKKEKEVKELSETQKFTFDDVYNFEDEDDIDEVDGKYPVLSYLEGLYKVLAWVVFVLLIITGIFVSLVFFKNSTLMVCAIMLVSVILSVIFLLGILAKAENIRWKLDIENHLNKLTEK